VTSQTLKLKSSTKENDSTKIVVAYENICPFRLRVACLIFTSSTHGDDVDNLAIRNRTQCRASMHYMRNMKLKYDKDLST